MFAWYWFPIVFCSLFLLRYVKARDTSIPDWNKHFNYYQIFSLTLGIGSYLHSFVISEQKSNSCLLVLPCRCIHGIRGLLFFAKKADMVTKSNKRFNGFFFTMNYKGIYKILYFDKHVQEYTINMLTHSHKYKYNIHSSMSLLETHLEVREARPKVGSWRWFFNVN